ncbi:hypothetical protein H5410_036651 [Solanum commersonii]|uniref:Uncharacterized protein n=1 Tax=Solanum commersonii TaxID=4109 RepID=A0A9J5Y452_SOLCO|nr:hypothetical protein H5410_036651 [Solanum commersonii]
MSFYTIFIDEKTLITILKVIPLNEDLQEFIICKIINDIIREDFSIHEYEESQSVMFARWTLLGLPRAEVEVIIQGEDHPQDRPRILFQLPSYTNGKKEFDKL